MYVKRVWGIIIIVLSVLMVLGCVHYYNELTTIDSLMQASLNDYGRTVKTWFSNSNTGKIYTVAVRNEKVLSFLGIILGVCLAGIGTYMIREAAPRHYRVSLQIAEPGPMMRKTSIQTIGSLSCKPPP